MVETQLTDQLIADGAALLARLDEEGISPDAALWFYFPDIRAWKLILAEISVGPNGPREVYRHVQRAINALAGKVSSLTLPDVAVAKPDAPLVKLLRQVVGTGTGTHGIRFTNSVINGTLIEGAYIYRLRGRTA